MYENRPVLHLEASRCGQLERAAWNRICLR